MILGHINDLNPLLPLQRIDASFVRSSILALDSSAAPSRIWYHLYPDGVTTQMDPPPFRRLGPHEYVFHELGDLLIHPNLGDTEVVHAVNSFGAAAICRAMPFIDHGEGTVTAERYGAQPVYRPYASYSSNTKYTIGNSESTIFISRHGRLSRVDSLIPSGRFHRINGDFFIMWNRDASESLYPLLHVTSMCSADEEFASWMWSIHEDIRPNNATSWTEFLQQFVRGPAGMSDPANFSSYTLSKPSGVLMPQRFHRRDPLPLP
jgi:hypothetical protein